MTIQKISKPIYNEIFSCYEEGYTTKKTIKYIQENYGEIPGDLIESVLEVINNSAENLDASALYMKTKEVIRARNAANVANRYAKSVATKDVFFENMTNTLIQEIRKSGNRKNPFIPTKSVINNLTKQAAYSFMSYGGIEKPDYLNSTNKVMGVILSDCHPEEVITYTGSNGAEEFNFLVFQNRLRKHASGIIRNKYLWDADELIIFEAGDMFEGVTRPDQLRHQEMGKFNALYKIAEAFAMFKAELVPHFKKITVCTVSGNHGRLQREVSYAWKDENFDNIIYVMDKMISEKYGLPSENFHINTQDFGIIDVNGFKIGYTHGHTVKPEQLVLDYKLDLCVQGHDHNAHYDGKRRVLHNGAYNRGNHWSTAQGFYSYNPFQYQSCFLIGKKQRNSGMELLETDFIEITQKAELYGDYGIEIEETKAFGRNDKAYTNNILTY